jgi:4a-hydroxytetrahydrobiopterin dehydratase
VRYRTLEPGEFSGLDPGWRVADGRLVRAWAFPDFATALAFAVRIGAEAERLDHHPDVALGWGYVRLSLHTHAAGGLTDADLALARAIDVISPVPPPPR